MNTSQKTICLNLTNLEGEVASEVANQVLETIGGFKACICVNQLTPALVKEIHKYNKNAVTPEDFDNTDITVKIVPGKSNFQKMEVGLSNLVEDFPVLMEQHGIDVGDHEMYDSAKTANKKEKDCKMCRIFKEKKEHILYESENFFVIVGLGAFTKAKAKNEDEGDGYVLICPKKHIMSSAECTPKEFKEFLQVLDDMKYILESVYGKKVFVFECGSGEDAGGKHTTSVVHAHIHLVPTDMPVLERVQRSGLYPDRINLEDLSQYKENPYKLYIDQKGKCYIVHDPNVYQPRQHARQILADYMGLEKDEYNWRTHPHVEELETIAREIYEFLKKNYKNLPSRIQKNVAKFMQEFPKGTE